MARWRVSLPSNWNISLYTHIFGRSGGNSTRRAFEDDLYVREEPTELFVRGVINPNDPNLSKDKLTQWWNNLDPAVRAKLQTYEPAV